MGTNVRVVWGVGVLRAWIGDLKDYGTRIFADLTDFRGFYGFSGISWICFCEG
ncbi:MAG: hypothetical protein FWG87_09125 [Defluviitaleaceae bacterium]|nr:hypothetical protein [Defluviitaleaceae bacterium]